VSVRAAVVKWSRDLSAQHPVSRTPNTQTSIPSRLPARRLPGLALENTDVGIDAVDCGAVVPAEIAGQQKPDDDPSLQTSNRVPADSLNSHPNPTWLSAMRSVYCDPLAVQFAW